MNKEIIRMIVLMVMLAAISIGVIAIPENTSVIDLIKGLYIMVIMLFVFVVMKDN